MTCFIILLVCEVDRLLKFMEAQNALNHELTKFTEEQTKFNEEVTVRLS